MSIYIAFFFSPLADSPAFVCYNIVSAIYIYVYIRVYTYICM